MADLTSGPVHDPAKMARNGALAAAGPPPLLHLGRERPGTAVARGGAQVMLDSRAIVVLAKDPDAVTGAAEYLTAMGVRAACIRSVDGALVAAAAAADAVVVFADEYPVEVAVQVVASLRAGHCAPLLMVVTEDRESFLPASRGAGIVVVHRAVWAWTLVEAMRGDSPSRASDR